MAHLKGRFDCEKYGFYAGNKITLEPGKCHNVFVTSEGGPIDIHDFIRINFLVKRSTHRLVRLFDSRTLCLSVY